jgi:short-subunit dehydrogenase
MADAMRMELAPWGIRVALVEPAQTDTDLWRHAEDELDSTSAQLSEEHRRLYARHIEGFRKTIPRSMKAAAPVDGVAAMIERALSDRRPKARYVVGRPAQVQAVLGRLMPTPVLDRMLALSTGVPRLSAVRAARSAPASRAAGSLTGHRPPGRSARRVCR